ncbi:MAG: phosphatidylserine decarboxylase [Campylobacterota bacterium]|nr:phosphatidylserine decarboxylase [Campylobacterota bacterium]
MFNNYILKEGYKYILIALGLSIIFSLFISDTLATFGYLITIFLLYIYRDRSRYIYSNSNSVLAPIDGKVIAIDKSSNNKTKIYLDVSLCDEHIVKSPFDGSVIVKKEQNGLNLNPSSFKANILNEQTVLKFQNEKTSMKIKLISGVFNIKSKFINCENLLQGDKVGVFINGIALITLQNENKPLVKIGDKIKSGQTIVYKI